MTGSSEQARQWVHVGSAGFALLLRVLTWQQAATLAAAALVFNLLVLPAVGGRRLYRPIDRARGYSLGILLYPLSVLALILLFRARLDIAAAAWGLFAVGDGAATLVGRRFPSRPLPWNPEKTVAGSAAFAVTGALAAIALAWWTRPAVTPAPSAAFTVFAPLSAALVAALVETIPVGLDDNVSVPAAAAGVLLVASLMSAAAWHRAAPSLLAALPWALCANAVAAWAGYQARAVSRSGVAAGLVIGIVVYVGGGPGAWGMLLTTFLAAAIASRVGLERKTRLGIAQERGGRRGAANALANCGIAAVAAVAASTTPYAAAALLALVAALVAGASDTVASEIGKAWGRSTYLLATGRRVPPGTPGAISLEGTAAGLAAAGGLAALAAAIGDIRPSATAIGAVVVGATAGALVESALGATLEGPGILNNDMLNFINTAVAAAVALALA